MSPISNDLADGLDSLKQQIFDAEAALCKIPGATKVSIELANDTETSCFLEFSGSEFQVDVFHHGTDETIESRKLSELPVPKRIELSKLIPQFIERAIAHEAEIAKEASEAAASIQQKLAEL